MSIIPNNAYACKFMDVECYINDAVKSALDSVLNPIEDEIGKITNEVVKDVDNLLSPIEKDIENIPHDVSNLLAPIEKDIESIPNDVAQAVKDTINDFEKDFKIIENALISVEHTVVDEIKHDIIEVKDSVITIESDVKYGFDKLKWFFTNIVDPIVEDSGEIIIKLAKFVFDVIKEVVLIVEFVIGDWDVIKNVLVYGTLALILVYVGLKIYGFVNGIIEHHRQKLILQHLSKQTKQNDKIISLLQVSNHK